MIDVDSVYVYVWLVWEPSFVIMFMIACEKQTNLYVFIFKGMDGADGWGILTQRHYLYTKSVTL